MNETYVVPIVPRNLCKNETIVQIAELLDHLQNVTNDIFNKVDARLQANKTRMNNISERINIAHTKINNLKGAKKATQVFSSSKYPANEINRDYVSIFEGGTMVELKRHKVKHKNYTPSNEPIDKVPAIDNINIESKQTNKCDGLGDIPINLDCVNDLLLYNSGKNLYKKFEMSDALKGPQHVKGDDLVNVSDIGMAPASIREGSSQNKSNVQPFMYTPKIGDVPELHVPLDLPDLPGIADDVRYENGNAPTIAPSANHTLLIADLPLIENLNVTQDSDKSEPLLPKPPPTLPEVHTEILPQLTVTNTNNNEVSEQKIVNLPRPPSPKLTVEEEHLPLPPPPKIIEQSSKQNKLPALPGLDARASLMEAIRQAGGSKKAKLKNIEKEIERPQEVKPSSGDLMADLHAKLSMRRKGISGTKKPGDENVLDGSSAFDKISARIPPPNKGELTDSTNTEDEDWDE